jgi:hypothetical protein
MGAGTAPSTDLAVRGPQLGRLPPLKANPDVPRQPGQVRVLDADQVERIEPQIPAPAGSLPHCRTSGGTHVGSATEVKKSQGRKTPLKVFLAGIAPFDARTRAMVGQRMVRLGLPDCAA